MEKGLDLDLRYGSQPKGGQRRRSYRRAPRLTRNMDQLHAAGAHVPKPMPQSQGAVVKGWIAPPGTTGGHCWYLQHKKGPDRADAVLFSPRHTWKTVDRFVRESQNDPHQFRFIVSLTAGRADVLQQVVLTLMDRMQSDLHRPLDWVAAVHQDTEYPHAHVLLRGRDVRGEDLYIRPLYLQQGIRYQVQDIATEILGLDLSTLRSPELAREMLKAVQAFAQGHAEERAQGVGR